MSGSKQFPATICPECIGRRADCALCKGKGVVSRFLAAAWYSDHPEAARADTEREMPAVRLPKDERSNK